MRDSTSLRRHGKKRVPCLRREFRRLTYRQSRNRPTLFTHAPHHHSSVVYKGRVITKGANLTAGIVGRVQELPSQRHSWLSWVSHMSAQANLASTLHSWEQRRSTHERPAAPAQGLYTLEVRSPMNSACESRSSSRTSLSSLMSAAGQENSSDGDEFSGDWAEDDDAIPELEDLSDSDGADNDIESQNSSNDSIDHQNSRVSSNVPSGRQEANHSEGVQDLSVERVLEAQLLNSEGGVWNTRSAAHLLVSSMQCYGLSEQLDVQGVAHYDAHDGLVSFTVLVIELDVEGVNSDAAETELSDIVA